MSGTPDAAAARTAQATGLMKKLDKFSKENSDLKQENAELKQQLRESKSKVDVESQTKLRDSEQELKVTKQKLNEQISEVSVTKSDLKEKGKELQESQNQISKLENDFKLKEDEIAHLNDMLSSKASELETVQHSKSDLEIQLQRKIKENEALTARLSTKERGSQGLNTELQQERQNYTQLHGEYMHLKGDMSQLQRNYSQLQQEYSSLQHQNSQQKFNLDQQNFDLQQKLQEQTSATNQLQLQKDDQVKQLTDNLQQLQLNTNKTASQQQSQIENLTSEKARLQQEYEGQIRQQNQENEQLKIESAQRHAAFTELQRRFDSMLKNQQTITSERDEAIKISEDSVTEMDAFAAQVTQSRNEIAMYKQTVGQKDTEIAQLNQKIDQLEKELQVRAGRLKDHEQTIIGLQQQTATFQQKFRDADVAREKLEEEVNKANKMVMGRNSTELKRLEHPAANPTPVHDMQRRESTSSGGQRSDPSRHGYDRAPLRDTAAQYQQHQQYNKPMDTTPNRFNYPHGGQERSVGGYAPIPGQVPDPRSSLNQLNQPWSPPAAADQRYKDNYHSPPIMAEYPRNPSPYGGGLEHSYKQRSGPLEASGGGANSNPCPLCGKRFPTEDDLVIHAGTCNYDPNAH